MSEFTYEAALESSKQYFAGGELEAKVFVDKYAMRDKDGNVLENTPDMMHDRLAKEFARIDRKFGLNFDTQFAKYRKALDKFARIVPQGSPMAAVGNQHQVMSASNCVVVASPKDSMEGILDAGKELAQLMKRRCGVGLDISSLRPENTPVNNAARTTSGAWSFADFFSYITRMVGQSGRRGALMVTLNVHHPDVIKFTTMKHDLTKVTGANVSVLLTDEFLAAVEKDKEYEQRWPLEGKPKIVRKVRARDVWTVIVNSATSTAEPGLLMWDSVLTMPTSGYKNFRSISTNPCVTADTWIQTATGPKQVSGLIAHPFKAVVNGKEYDSSDRGFFYTGDKEVFTINTVEGPTLSVTRDHKIHTEDGWVEAGQLLAGQKITLNRHSEIEWEGTGGTLNEGYLLGALFGDGHLSADRDLAQLAVWDNGTDGHNGIMKMISDAVENMPKRSDFAGWRKIKDENKYVLKLAAVRDLAQKYNIKYEKMITKEMQLASSDFYKGFLRGFFDADGSVQGNHEKGISVRLGQINAYNLQIVQRMLFRLGVYSKIYFNRRGMSLRPLPDGKGGTKEYLCQAMHELVISGESLSVYQEVIGFADTDKSIKLSQKLEGYRRKLNNNKFECTFSGLTYRGIEPVYDATIDEVHAFDANGILVHNCSEIPLSAYDSCRLISLNLTGYVRNAFERSARFDLEAFIEDIKLATQMSDNLVDLELELIKKIQGVCEPGHEQALWQKLYEAGRDGRRTGLGTHGLADMLAQLNIKYDSNKALEQVELIYSTLRDVAYDTSVELAKIRGPFPAWDWNKEKDSPFIKALPRKLQNKIKRHGRRNIAQLTQAPTGSVSIVSKCGEFNSFNVSSGVEPVFRNFYIRRKKINHGDSTSRVDFVDAMGDAWQEFKVYHGNVKNFLTKKGLSDTAELPTSFITSDQISWEKRLEIQAIEQKYIDHAISSTINLPRGTEAATVGEIYLASWKKGLKGVTVYVDGSRDGVLISEPQGSEHDSNGRPIKIKPSHAPKRPDEMVCEIHQVSVKANKWIILVGLLDGVPYELFAGAAEQLVLPSKFKTGKIVKIKQGQYDLHCGEGEEELVVKNIVKVFDNPESAWATRMISMSLRHGVDVSFITEQLNKEGNITDVNKVLARVLKKYIPNGTKVKTSAKCEKCQSTNLVFEEGCHRCIDCLFSKCG